jgi:hypothetical protein
METHNPKIFGVFSENKIKYCISGELILFCGYGSCLILQKEVMQIWNFRRKKKFQNFRLVIKKKRYRVCTRNQKLELGREGEEGGEEEGGRRGRGGRREGGGGRRKRKRKEGRGGREEGGGGGRREGEDQQVPIRRR